MNVEKIFGTRVFDDSAMKKRLPQKVYQSLLRTRRLKADILRHSRKAQESEHMKSVFVNTICRGIGPAFDAIDTAASRLMLSDIDAAERNTCCDGVFQQSADSGRGGFLLLPLRRLAGNL